MLRINLLPVKKIKQRAEAWRQLKIFGVVFVALLAVLAVVIFGLISKVNGLNTYITTLEAKKQKLAQTLKEIEELEKKKKEIDKQSEIVQNLDKSSALAAHALNEVANLVPNERLWLTSFNQSGPTLKLNGIALDDQTVAEFMNKLTKSKYMTNVILDNTALLPQSGRNLKSFVLSSSVSIPDPEKKEVTPEGPGTAAQKN
jgi:type IV pilus assembly protein PilN